MRIRMGMVMGAAVTMAATALVASPAMAGDVAAPNGTVAGDWSTRSAGFTQTVTFDKKGNVYGDAGCNRFTGSYRVHGNSLTIGPLASTLKFCEGRMDAEQSFLMTLQDATTYRATTKVLKIYSPDSMLRLRAA
ncbi:MAG: META domain-containing protein [Actinomycetales bacterium]|nr:META domain-containing protein [Actinomycetales bacterium]